MTTPTNAVKVVIADDEELARQRIRDLLDERSGMEIVAECRDGEQAVQAIHQHAPDLVFLDIRMPGVDGFEVIQRVGKSHMPPVIFVTAFDQFALQAFDAAAVDYLLKPFDRQRFDHAVARALARHQSRQVARLEQCLDQLTQLNERQSKQYPERLMVRDGGSSVILKVDDIDWIESARNYLKIHAGDEMHLMRETMTNIEQRLDPERFIRIHRSTLVNIERIHRIEPAYGSESRVELEDGTHLMISRAYRRGKVKHLLQPYG